MSEKKLSVVIAVKDLLTGFFKSSTSAVRKWSEGVTKIAAGIGLADSFKEIGRGIKESVAAAAEAYPKLAAPFQQLAKTFSEVKIQAGAAFLEALRPVVPFLQSVLLYALELAKELPNAVDGAKIMWVDFVAGVEKVPGRLELALARMLRALATFVAGASTLLSRVFGVDVGDTLVTSLDAAAARLGGEGSKKVGAIEADRAARVNAIGSTVHSFGPRAETEDEKRARQQREAEAKKLEEQNLARQREERLKAGGGGNSLTGGDRATQGGNAGVEAANRAQGATGILAGSLTAGEGARSGEVTAERIRGVSEVIAEATKQFSAFNLEAALSDEVLGKLAGDTLVSLTDGFEANFAAIGRGRNVFSGLAKAALKPVADEAKGYGRLGIGKGILKIKDSIWPPNPAGLLSGVGMVAAGGALVAAAGQVAGGGGGGGGGGGATSSSGIGPGTFQNDQRSSRESQGRATFVVPDDYGMTPQSPQLVEWFVKAWEAATGRKALIVPQSAIGRR